MEVALYTGDSGELPVKRCQAKRSHPKHLHQETPSVLHALKETVHPHRVETNQFPLHQDRVHPPKDPKPLQAARHQHPKLALRFQLFQREGQLHVRTRQFPDRRDEEDG